MSDKSTYFFNKNFSVFLTDVRKRLVAENYETAFGHDEDLKPAEAFMTLFEAACANNQKAIDRQRFEELSRDFPIVEVQLKEANEEIERLKNELAEKEKELLQAKETTFACPHEERCNDLLEENKSLQAEITARDHRIDALEINVRDALNQIGIPEGSVLVKLTDKEILLIESICAEESQRTGTTVTAELLLKNVFFFVLVNGPHDMIKTPVTVAKLRQFIQP